MIKSDNFTFGAILTVLITATIIGYTSKRLFETEEPKKLTNQMYDWDQNFNKSPICIFSRNAYSLEYDKSICFNKTLLQWYNPWFRHSSWIKFWNKIKLRNEIKRLKLSLVEVNNKINNLTKNKTVLSIDNIEPNEKVKEKPVEFVYSILIGLLIISGILACWEVCKDKLKRNEGSNEKVQNRECSLADFTINRHLRRESQQQQAASNLPRQNSLEYTAKVTQNLIHESSLDRAFSRKVSEALISQVPRRNSVPVSLSSDFPTGVSSSSKLKLTKRQSVDVPGEELNVDFRKKSRHFIRRH